MEIATLAANADVQAARYIGAGLACTALIGAGVGIGVIFGNYQA